MEPPADQDIVKEFLMNKYEERLLTFKGVWPFTVDCLCTPENMARAGFYYSGGPKEPDLVICYVCQKELDGWEPEDDPWKEHIAHSKNCPVLKAKNPDNITVQSFLKLEEQRQKYLLESTGKKLIEEYFEYAETGRAELEKLSS